MDNSYYLEDSNDEDHVHVLRSGLSSVSACSDTIYCGRYPGIARACSFRLEILITVLLTISIMRPKTCTIGMEMIVNIGMSMSWISNIDKMCMVLQLILLHSELFIVVTSPEEPLLIVKVRSEFPSPGRGMFYSGAVTSLPAGRKIYRLSFVAGHFRHPGDDRSQGQVQAGQVLN